MTQRGDGFARINGVAAFVKNVSVGWKGNVKFVKCWSYLCSCRTRCNWRI
ncbi:hypothetical protein [Candidatus Nanopusillus massiliensis]|nr:hypothetical protein [Candidatus Nanopusillus massiliensis]